MRDLRTQPEKDRETLARVLTAQLAKRNRVAITATVAERLMQQYPVKNVSPLWWKMLTLHWATYSSDYARSEALHLLRQAIEDDANLETAQ